MTDTPITHPLSPRLRELSDAVTQGREAVAREFTMRVPAEPDRDADLVLSRAADELDKYSAEGGRPEYVLALLIAGGYVSQAKVDEARAIALGFAEGPMTPADAELARLRAEVEAKDAAIAALRVDAERGRYMLRNAEWFRFDERTHLAVRVPNGSDLSCKAMREHAIDAARAEGRSDG